MDEWRLFKLLEIMGEKQYSSILYPSVSSYGGKIKIYHRLNNQLYISKIYGDPSDKTIKISGHLYSCKNYLYELVGNIGHIEYAKDLLKSKSYLGCLAIFRYYYCFEKCGTIYMLIMDKSECVVNTMEDNGDHGIDNIYRRLTDSEKLGSCEFEEFLDVILQKANTKSARN
jgi:uncharacterized protein YacL (UPF0231 family)